MADFIFKTNKEVKEMKLPEFLVMRVGSNGVERQMN